MIENLEWRIEKRGFNFKRRVIVLLTISQKLFNFHIFN